MASHLAGVVVVDSDELATRMDATDQGDEIAAVVSFMESRENNISRTAVLIASLERSYAKTRRHQNQAISRNVWLWKGDDYSIYSLSISGCTYS